MNNEITNLHAASSNETAEIQTKSDKRKLFKSNQAQKNDDPQDMSDSGKCKNNRAHTIRSFSLYSSKKARSSIDDERSNSIMNKDSAISTSKAATKKQKFKILLLIATVSCTFALTWLPAHVIQIWKVAFNSSFPYSESMYIIKFLAHTLSYSNSFLNPFIYVFIGAKFRSHLYSEFEYLLGICFKDVGRSKKLNRTEPKSHTQSIYINSNKSVRYVSNRMSRARRF
jgi:hypothetical protein